MGGKRQSNILASLISNFETVEEVIESSMNSSGSAIAENEKWMDSIAGKSEQLTNAMQALWNNTINSDIIKWFLDVALGATKVVDAIGLLPSALGAALIYFTAFKKQSVSGLFKDMYLNLQNYQQALYKLNSLNKLNLDLGATGSFNTAAVNAYAAAVSGLTAQKQAEMLATSGLNKVQIAEVMARNGVQDAVIQETLSKTNLSSTTAALHTTTVQEVLATQLSSDALKEKAVADFLAANGSKRLTAELLAQMVQQELLTKEQAANIASSYALAGANKTLGASFKTVGLGIKAAFMSNPIGMILTIITSVVSLISWLGSLKKSNEELIQQAAELKNAYKEESDVIQGNISTLQGLEEEFNKLSRGVDDYGNNISLATDDYERYREIIETIVGISPDLISGYDKEGNALVNKNGLIQKSIDLMQEEQRLKAKEYLSNDNIKTITKGAFAELDENTKNITVPFDIAYTSKILEDGTTQSGYVNRISDYIEQAIGVDFKQQGIDRYIQENLDLVEDNIGAILNNASKDFTDASGSTWKGLSAEQVESLETYIYSIIDATNSASDEIREMLQLVPQQKTGFYDLEASTQEFLNNYTNSFHITKDTTEADINAMIDEVSKFTDFIIHNSDVESTIQVGFNLNSGKDKNGNGLSVSQYQQQVEDFKKKIQESAYSDEQKNTLLSMFGLDDDDVMDNDIEKAIVHATNLLQDEFDKNIDGLSISDVLITTKITEDPNSLTFEELKQKIQEIKDITGINITPVKTYSVMVEELENYNDILSQTSEIITNDTEVTQEYKDALIELGVSAEDLNECFYENNPLVVKNAKALNTLVRDTKKVTAQNIQLAKSQAKLEYYEKYKELKQLTNGQKVSSAATLSQVKALYQEMTALQKTISKYSMLEHQLLGATNAYEEFAKAQEIDAANDYESKAEELVGHLVDAFHTAKLGSESAQAAIKGLVPESVYEDLDTLDDKMQAVYDYFTTDLSKYFYVKFNDDGSLESAEMLIDNVKQFVEDGIGKGVFTGSWEEWDLDPTINSLDELADKMGVTKEVAYAFLQAMETYDISWIGGDASTLLDKLLPSTAEIKALGEQMQNAYKEAGLDSDIDLTQRVKVSREVMLDKGWDIGDGEYATVNSISAYASEFGLSDKDGNDYAINLTPILPDGTVIEGGENGFKDWIRKQLESGKTLEDLDIILGSYKTMDEAVAKAKELHKIQEDYYNMVKSYSLENEIYSNTQKQAELQYKIGTGQITADTVVGADGKTTAGEQLKQLNKDAEENAKAARENATAWTEANKSYEDAKKVVTDLNGELDKAHKANNDKEVARIQGELEKAEGTLWDTYAALVKCGEPTEVTLTVAMEQVQKDLENLKKDMTNDELNIASRVDISNLKKGEDGKWIVDIEGYSQLDEASKAKVQDYISYLAEEHNINILQGEGAVTTLDVLSEIKKILSDTYTLMVQTNEAETKAQSFLDIWNNINSKSVTLGLVKRITEFFTRTPDEGDGAGVNGTAHVGGTTFAGGSWGAPRTETALTGELGPEILVRNGRWTTIGENGAEFTDIKKGDIIFNHKQTESLLKNGYVTGRGKAYVGGTAYAGEVHPWTGGMNISRDWDNITPSLWDAATNGEYLSDASDAANDFAETFDWIEVRLEEINEQLDLMNAQLENAGDYASKNNIIDQMMGVNTNKMANLMAGIQKYSDYAARLLADVPAQYREAAQDGAIAITEFVGEADEKTVEAIEKYREWAQKVADLKQELEGVKTELRELAIQKIDNIQEFGSSKTAIEDAQTEKLQNRVDLDEEKGLVTASAYYTAMMENSGKKIEYWTPLLKDMQKQFDAAVKSGEIKVGTPEWYDNLAKLYEVQSEIDSATIELEEFQNAINDIYWANFDNLINQFEYLENEAQNLIDILSSGDMVVTPETEDGWNADQVEWTKEGIASMGLYAQQMQIAEAKAQSYAKAIDDLQADYKAGKYSQTEYLEKLDELTSAQAGEIKKVQEAKDAIVDLNQERIDAIKEGIEREIEAYEELIDAKKKELEVEKDLYDFQKSAEEQQKNIADIQRKLAALSGDNSASAVAKRKQLEAELAEAQAEKEEMYYERSLTNKQDALDKELESFAEEKEAEITKWEEYLENIEQVVTDSLAIVSANADGIAETLTTKAGEYNLTLSDAILSPWTDGATAIGDYTTAFGDSYGSTMDMLNAIRDKWQEIIDKKAEAGNTDVSNINKENANYAAATYTPPAPSKPATTQQQKQETPKPSLTKGSYVEVKPGTKWYADSSGGGASGKAKSGTIKYINTSGSHAYNIDGLGWIKKDRIVGYRSGTKGVKKDQLAFIDEMGLEELVMHAGPDGRLQYLSKGTSVLNSELTDRIMDLAMNPQDVLDRNRPRVGLHPEIHNTEIHIDNSIGELIHIDKCDQGTLPDVQKIVDKALNKHMQNLNNSLKRYTRG